MKLYLKLYLIIGIALFNSCVSVKNAGSGLWPDSNQSKEEGRIGDEKWINQLMTKPEEKVIINQKDADYDEYNFRARTLNDSTINVWCFFKDKSVKTIILWDCNDKIATFSNGSNYHYKAKKLKSLLRCSTFRKGETTQEFTSYIKVEVKSLCVGEGVKSKMLDKFVAGDLQDFNDEKPVVLFERKGLSQNVLMQITDIGDNAGLISYAVNNSPEVKLEGIENYRKTLNGEKLFSVTVKDNGDNITIKKYVPFNTPISTSGSFLPFYKHGIGSSSFNMKTQFYADSYKSKDIFMSSSYGVEWHKYAFGCELEVSASKRDNSYRNSGKSSSIGGDASITGLFFSPSEKDGLILGLGFYSTKNNIRLSSLIEKADAKSFLDTIQSVYYDGSVFLSDSLSFTQLTIPLKIGWKMRLSENITWASTLATSVFTIQKGGVKSYSKNNGVEGLYYPESKTLQFVRNNSEYETLAAVDKKHTDLLDDLNIVTCINFQVKDFQITPSLSYNLNKVNDMYYSNSFAVSLSLNYRIWW